MQHRRRLQSPRGAAKTSALSLDPPSRKDKEQRNDHRTDLSTKRITDIACKSIGHHRLLVVLDAGPTLVWKRPQTLDIEAE
jgi:hypothetical protein